MHLARVAEPVDELFTTLVIKRLSRPDARLLLTADNGEDVGALGSEAAVLRVRLDEVAALFADGAVTGRQLAEATAKLRAKFTDVELRPATATAGSPLVGFADAEGICGCRIGHPCHATWAYSWISPPSSRGVAGAGVTVTQVVGALCEVLPG